MAPEAARNAQAKRVKQALYILKSIATVHNPWIFFDGSLYELGLSQRQFWLMVLSIAALFAGDVLRRRGISAASLIQKQDLWCRWMIYIAATLIILIFGVWGAGYDAQAFVYFQF